MIAKDRLQNILSQISFNPNFLAKIVLVLPTDIKNPSDERTQHISSDEVVFEVSIELKDKDTGKLGFLVTLASFKVKDLEDTNEPDSVFCSDILAIIVRMFSHEIQENFMVDNKVYHQPHQWELFRPLTHFATEHLIRFIPADNY